MATQCSVYCKFSDGTFASLVNTAVNDTDGSAGHNINTIQTGGNGLAQVSSVDIGQAFVGKLLTHAIGVWSTEDSNAGAWMYGYILGANGKIKTLIQGGGSFAIPVVKLAKPVRMAVGDKLQVAGDTAAAGATQAAALAVYCRDGTCDVFSATIANDTKTPMTNKESATVGQALAGKTIAAAYATVSTQFNVNESLAGNSGYYIEAADGQLKAMYPPGGNGLSPTQRVEFQAYPVSISQNDTLSVMGSHS